MPDTTREDLRREIDQQVHRFTYPLHLKRPSIAVQEKRLRVAWDCLPSLWEGGGASRITRVAVSLSSAQLAPLHRSPLNSLAPVIAFYEALAISEVLALAEEHFEAHIVITADVETERARVIGQHYPALQLKPDATAQNIVWELSHLTPPNVVH